MWLLNMDIRDDIMKKAYSIIVHIIYIDGIININSVYITDNTGAHVYTCKDKTAVDNMDCVIAYGYMVAINNGYKKPTYYTEFNTIWFNEIRILDDTTLHNYPYKSLEILNK